MAEELCVDTILPLLKDDTGIQLRFEYSENDDSSISVRITYAGENTDPLEKANELSAVLISHVLSDISFSYDKGICLIDAKLVR